MLPHRYICNSCREAFSFSFREALYYVGAEPFGTRVADSDLLSIPVRPAWCKDCACLCLVEDIAPVREFEAAYGLAKSGRATEYPLYTEYLSREDAVAGTEAYLRWRMGRRHQARSLCCGRSDFHFLDVEQPLIKHAECDFGFVEGYMHISSSNGRPLGVYSPANIRVYSGEGDLLGRLTWRKREEEIWEVEAMYYAPILDDLAD